MTPRTSDVAVCCSSDLRSSVSSRAFDGDDRLGGEVPDQLDLFVGEWTDFLTEDTQSADRGAFLEHRYDQHAARAAEIGHRDHRWIASLVGGIYREVDDMDKIAGCGCARHRRQRSGWKTVPRWKCSAKAVGMRCWAPTRNASSSQSSKLPNCASQRRAALASIASKTGVKSLGELEITRSTSAVAVGRSSDRRNSASSRAFSMAMTACAAKFSTSAICLSVNGRTSWRQVTNAPTHSSSFIIGTQRAARAPTVSTKATTRGSPM